MPSQRQSYTSQRRTPIEGGGMQTETFVSADNPQGSQRQSRGYVPSPTRAGEKVGSVGLLLAEFIACEGIIGAELFTGTGTYGDKMMSAMKRGFTTAVLFFVLSLMAATGDNIGKISKGIGALVFVAVLLTSPVTEMFASTDKFFRANWTGTTEEGTDTVSSDASSSSTGAPKVAGSSINSDISNALLWIRQQPINVIKGLF